MTDRVCRDPPPLCASHLYTDAPLRFAISPRYPSPKCGFTISFWYPREPLLHPLPVRPGSQPPQLLSQGMCFLCRKPIDLAPSKNPLIDAHAGHLFAAPEREQSVQCRQGRSLQFMRYSGFGVGVCIPETFSFFFRSVPLHFSHWRDSMSLPPRFSFLCPSRTLIFFSPSPPPPILFLLFFSPPLSFPFPFSVPYCSILSHTCDPIVPRARLSSSSCLYAHCGRLAHSHISAPHTTGLIEIVLAFGA